MNRHRPIRFGTMRTRWVCILALLAVLTTCGDFTRPVADEIAFLSAITPVNNWDELENAVENTNAGLIALTASFPTTENDTIAVDRSVTITAMPGTAAVITRTALTGAFFTVGSSGGLTLGHPAGGTLVLDGGAGSGLTATGPLVQVTAGNLTVEGGAELRNNHNTPSGNGGAVSVDGGAFTMKGGTISGNTANGDGDGGGVRVGASGAFTMSGGTISGNTGGGGGVSVDGSGAFAMSGGTISNNTGGGVHVYIGSFTMSGGTISNNTATSDGGGVYVYAGSFTMSGTAAISGNNAPRPYGLSGGGGGVHVGLGSSFYMLGGTINGNTATGNTATGNDGSGGGVYFAGTTFDMSGGTISNNTATSDGGGVYATGSGPFAMSGGTISNNTATGNYGGGVNVMDGGFNMSGGTISGNTATGTYSHGGGVYVSLESFAMSGGTISGNSAISSGGGVYMLNGAFTKSGASIIYGSLKGDGTTPEDPLLKNTGGNGHAVYVNASSDKKRNKTAGPGVDLDSTYSGPIPGGGWE